MKRTNCSWWVVGFVVSALTLTACSDGSIPTSTEETTQFHQQSTTHGVLGKGNPRKIPNQYIVAFKTRDQGPDIPANVLASGRKLVEGKGADVFFTYDIGGFKAVAVHMPDGKAEALSNHPHIAWVEQDAEVEIETTQADPTWGLDRVDQTNLPLDDQYVYGPAGNGVRVYIIDTGIDLDHPEFGGRVSTGIDVYGGNGDDCHGHGTHVAGTVGSATYGIAKQVSLFAVRVMNCNGFGSYSNMIAGIDYVSQQKQDNPSIPMVANMSIGGGYSASLNRAVNGAVSQGVVVSVAAGNQSTDACTKSPASAEDALTVGASHSGDSRTSVSNYGTCLDLWAPGASIKSTWMNGGTKTVGGTSMAAPHVAGVAALYMELNPSSSAETVSSAIVNNATQGALQSVGSGSPNKLLYSGFLIPSSNSAPEADFQWVSNYLDVTFSDLSSDSDGSLASWSWDFGDGAETSTQNPSHTYASAGTYTVTLVVTDDNGASDGQSKSISVSAPNQAPVADFTYTAEDLTATFYNGSTDADGSIVETSWDFGDPQITCLNCDEGSVQSSSVTHTFSSAGTYAVTLTVTDDDGASNSVTKDVTVYESSLPPDYDDPSNPPGNTDTVDEIAIEVRRRGRSYVLTAEAYTTAESLTAEFRKGGEIIETVTGNTHPKKGTAKFATSKFDAEGESTFTVHLLNVEGVINCSVTLDQTSNVCR